MNKLKLRQLCEAADVDLDVIPRKLPDPENDLADLISALEGKNGDPQVEVLFQNPKGGLKKAEKDEAEEEDEDNTPKRSSGKKFRR